MQIKGQDARSIGVYKGRELLDGGIREKNEGKEIRTRTIGRKRESNVYPCVRKFSSGGLEKNHQCYLFLTSIHSLPIQIFGLEPDLFSPLSQQIFIYLGLIGWYKSHYFKWVWAPKFRALTDKFIFFYALILRFLF